MAINFAQLYENKLLSGKGGGGVERGKQMAKCFWQTAIYCCTSMQFSCSSVLFDICIFFHSKGNWNGNGNGQRENASIEKTYWQTTIHIWLFIYWFQNKLKVELATKKKDNGKMFHLVNMIVQFFNDCAILKLIHADPIKDLQLQLQLELNFAYLVSICGTKRWGTCQKSRHSWTEGEFMSCDYSCKVLQPACLLGVSSTLQQSLPLMRHTHDWQLALSCCCCCCMVHPHPVASVVQLHVGNWKCCCSYCVDTLVGKCH